MKIKLLKTPSLKLFFTFLFFVLGPSLFAQNIRVTGTVVDENDQLLPGVQIFVKGTSTGTITDFDGAFELNAAPGAVVVFNYVGYVDSQVKVVDATPLTIKMKPDMQSLEEVVVIGYGTAKKKDLTGSVGSVKVKEMNIAPVASFDEALAGRVSGVQVTSTQGRPGSPTDIVIRGTGSLTQSSAPLYVIDGFPIEDFDMSSIDQGDIESMEILKGPSAIAIYGARAANGVILITTKNGVVGQTEVTFNTFYGVNQITNELDVLTPYDFVDLQYELNDEAATRNRYGDLSLYKDKIGVDWQGEVFRDTDVKNNSLTISGGTEETKYNLAISNYKSNGIMLNSGFERTYLKLKLNQKVTDKLKVGTNISYTISEVLGTHTSSNILSPTGGSSSARFNLLKDVVQGRPTGGLFYSNEELLTLADDPETDVGAPISNPIVNALNQERSDLKQAFIFNGFAQYTVIKGLDVKVQGGLTKTFRRFSTFDHVDSAYERRNGQTRGTIINYEYTNKLLSTTVTYKKSFGKHKTTTLLGYDYQDRETFSTTASASGFPEPNLGLDDLGMGTVAGFPSSFRSPTDRVVSLFARLTYNYAGKYLFTGTVRRDGSSKFGENNKFGTFPSVSGAWRFSDEDFVADKADWLSDGKLRLEWGQVGNNRIPTGVSQPLLGGETYGVNNGVIAAVSPTNLMNQDIRWEAQEQINIGLDLGFLDNRILFNSDIYRKDSKDLLLLAPIPASSGFDQVYRNIGKIRNEGLELSLSTINIQTDEFSWNSNFNISFPTTKTLALAEDNVLYSTSGWYGGDRFNNDFITEVGEPFGMMYGFVDDGLYRPEHFDPVTGDPDITVSFNSDLQAGYRRYKDLNGDGTIDDNDRTVLGNPRPIHFGGFSNSFSYKGFDMNIFLQWSFGNDIYNANRILYTSDLGKVRNFLPEVLNRWRTDLPADSEHNQNATFRSALDTSPVLTSAYIEDGSYLRLKTVSLGYTLPKTVTERMHVKKLRLYITGQNLFTWTNYTGYDPEVSTRGRGLTSGVDFGAYPRSKTFITGLSVTF